MNDSRPARPGLARALAQCRHLDWRDPGLWPPLPRRALCALAASLVALPAWTLLSADAEADLQAARAREPALRQALVERFSQAAQGAALPHRRQALQDEVASLERDLPSGVELDALLAALHRAALRQGLQVELIRPEPASGQAGADDVPVALRLSGGYHALGAFAAEVAALEPPVTLHELQASANARDAALTLEATARGHRRTDAATAARLAASAAREMRP